MDSLTSAKTLYLFSTRTGIAPFVSLVPDPATYKNFDKIVLTHTCRTVPELEFGSNVISNLKRDPLVSKLINGRLIYDTSVTKDFHHTIRRIKTRVISGALFKKNGLSPLSKYRDRVMICGSSEMLGDMAIFNGTISITGGLSKSTWRLCG